MKLIIPLFVFLLLSAPTRTHALEKETLSKTAFVVSYLPDNEGWKGMAGTGLHITQHFTPEFSLTGGLDQYTFKSKTDNWIEGNFKVNAMTVTARYSPNFKKDLLPFIGVGYGFYAASYLISPRSKSTPNRAYLDGTVDNPVGYHFSTGIELPIAKKIRLATELRYIKMSAYTEYKYTDDSNITEKVVNDTQNLNTFQFFLSLVYLY